MEKLSKDRELIDLIIYLNTEAQLYDRGVNSDGIRLDSIGGSYASSTIAIKESKGQPTDRVTLRDSGDFYNSWIVFLNDDYDLEINADPIKETGNLFNRWGKEIVGLTDENLVLVVKMAKRKIIELIRNHILIN